MELQVRTVTKLSGIKKIWKIYLLDFSNRVFLPLTSGGLIRVGKSYVRVRLSGSPSESPGLYIFLLPSCHQLHYGGELWALSFHGGLHKRYDWLPRVRNSSRS